jgi:GNAT superfamily N-acetyltransferase
MDRVLRPASDADKEWLEALRRAAYHDLFDATWGGWDEARHLRHFSEFWKSGHISVVSVDGRQVGVVQVFESKDLVEVGEIQVLPAYQNQGIGTRILADVIECGRKKGKSTSLSLGLKNDAALRLYERLGFVETDRSSTHILMIHHLTHP